MRRGKPLKRGKPLQRGKPMRRGKGPRRKPRKQPSAAEQERAKTESRAFRESGRRQRVCALCGKTGSGQSGYKWDAHHVITKTYLNRNGYPIWHPDNALRLCKHPCHEHHTTAHSRLPLKVLRDENIEYAVRLLGEDGAYDYLTRHYVGADPRVAALVEREAA